MQKVTYLLLKVRNDLMLKYLDTMKRVKTELERLKFENELLKLQVEIVKSDNLFYKQLANENLNYRRESIEQFSIRISLLKTIAEQQNILRRIIFSNSGHLGISDFTRNVYHLVYQN